MNIFSSKKLVSSVISDFKNGVPIGHKSMNLSKKKFWHPFMTQYLLGIRHDIAIINPYITKKMCFTSFLYDCIAYETRRSCFNNKHQSRIL